MAGKAIGAVVAIVVVIVVIVAAVALIAVIPSGTAMKLTSSAFSEGGNIPAKYAADGSNVSPPLSIQGVDNRAVTLALIVDDPDANGFAHWAIWNIPATTSSIPEDVPASENVDTLGGARQGANDFGSVGYGGPDPPLGTTHTYRFRLYALDTTLDLSAGASKAQLESAMQGHTLAVATLTGKYGH